MNWPLTCSAARLLCNSGHTRTLNVNDLSEHTASPCEGQMSKGLQKAAHAWLQSKNQEKQHCLDITENSASPATVFLHIYPQLRAQSSFM